MNTYSTSKFIKGAISGMFWRGYDGNYNMNDDSIKDRHNLKVEKERGY